MNLVGIREQLYGLQYVGTARSYHGYDISFFLNMYGLWVSMVSVT